METFGQFILFVILGGAALIHMMKKFDSNGVVQDAAQKGIASWLLRKLK
jgi:hypothetical protein